MSEHITPPGPPAGVPEVLSPNAAPPAPLVPPGPPDAAPAPKSRTRRLVVVAVASALALAVVGTGVGYTAVTVNGADRNAGAPRWQFPDWSAGHPKPVGDSELAHMMLPVPDGYRRGPDIAGFGSDTQLSGKQAVALRKESLRTLPHKERTALEKQIDKQHIKGMAMRSYSHLGADEGAPGAVLEMTLSQMENTSEVRRMAAFQSSFLDALKVFRQGPEIKGHKNAQCFLPPEDSKEELGMMICSAYQGEVIVSATAYGVKPFDIESVTSLLTQQLDRIESPGESV